MFVVYIYIAYLYIGLYIKVYITYIPGLSRLLTEFKQFF